MKNVLLVDGNAVLYRAYYAVRFEPMYGGTLVNAVYGFASTMHSCLEAFAPEYVYVAFDTKEKTFRHDLLESYKAQRVKAPDDFYAQIPLVDRFLEAGGFPVLRCPGFEADDIIGTLAVQAANQGHQAIIVSGDMDFTQIVNEHVRIARLGKNMGPEYLMGAKEVEEKYGVRPEQMADYKALCGDSSDNYKGVPGIGPKKAEELLKAYETIEGILEHMDDLPKSVRAKLEAADGDLPQNRTLARIHTDVPLPQNIDMDSLFRINEAGVTDFLGVIGFPSLVMKYRTLAINLNKKSEQTGESPTPKQEKPAEESEQMSLF